MLRSRLIFGTLMTLAALAVLVLDPLAAPFYPVLALAIAVIGWKAAGELSALMQQLPVPVSPPFCRFGTVFILMSNWFMPVRTGIASGPDMHPSLVGFVICSMLAFFIAAWSYRQPGFSTIQIAGHVFCFFYIGVLGSFLVQLRWLPEFKDGQSSVVNPAFGSLAIFLTIFTAKVCDIGAYTAGRLFGRHKLAPILSPGKTWEGSVGGLASAALLAVATVRLTRMWFQLRLLSTAATFLFGFLVALAAMAGDLMESLIKRDCQTKDASSTIPGFGGVLDVIDSVLFAGPVAYAFLWGLRGVL